MNDKEKRDAAVDEFANVMKARLDWAANKGYTGWDGEYPSDCLRAEIYDDAIDMETRGEDEKSIDIANRCMMLWHRSRK